MLTGGTIGSLENVLSTAVFNCRILPILGLQRPPEGKATLVTLIPQVGSALIPLIPLGSGVEVLLILVPLITLGSGVEVLLIPI